MKHTLTCGKWRPEDGLADLQFSERCSEDSGESCDWVNGPLKRKCEHTLWPVK